MNTPRFLNPFTDFGFKRLFGQEKNKDLLIHFLNQVLKDEAEPIIDLDYLNTELLGQSVDDRSVIFDLYCKTSSGTYFIVELQTYSQTNFKERILYYSTFAIQQQAQKGKWDFSLKKVFAISLLDFILPEDPTDDEEVKVHVQLVETSTKKIFYDKLTYIYLQLPKFNKHLQECVSPFDKWLYFIKNLEKLNRIPNELQENIFMKLLDEAELAKLNHDERYSYEMSLKRFRDYHNVIDHSFVKGIEKGKIEGKIEGKLEGKQESLEEVCEQMLLKGFSPEVIHDVTGLSMNEILDIKNSLKN